MNEKECSVPDFSNIAESYLEDTTMEMAFNASRINDLTNKLNVATIERIDEIAIERECYLKRLKDSINKFEAEIRRIP